MPTRNQGHCKQAKIFVHNKHGTEQENLIEIANRQKTEDRRYRERTGRVESRTVPLVAQTAVQR